MKKLFIKGHKIEFDSIIEFNQSEINLLECFFFKGSKIVANEFLTEQEFNNIKKQTK